MNTLRYIISVTLLAALCGCGVPSYSLKGPLAVEIEVTGTDGGGFVMINKLNSSCAAEAKFNTAIGKNPRRFYIDDTDHFSFQLIYISPLQVGCKVQNTIPIRYGTFYQIFLETPRPGAPKDQQCKVSYKTRNANYTNRNYQTLPDNFEGTCEINERF